jgi:glycosyltransferase involved in cell wall biosynthesis
MSPLVSIITPTFQREHLLEHAVRWVQEQTYPNIEWLVLDDSPEPSRILAGVSDPRLRYEHSTQRMAVGEKRNRLIDRARGEFIAHFDDDDYYAPRYLQVMMDSLEGGAADFVNLNSWYLFDLRRDFFGFWDLRQTTGLHYLCQQDKVRLAQFSAENNAHLADNYLGFGFTYVYRRSVWSAASFPPLDWNEDTPFAKAAAARFKAQSIGDRSGLVLHVLHPSSSSSCFPQYHLPSFLLPQLFEPCREVLGKLRWNPVAQGVP